ncbi:MAG: CoA-binding protein [Dehalococcoidia bacterium]|nr:CoA-binding protein [Dehalococcoidia bacterium]
MHVSRERLDRALNPRTVAVIGDKEKFGYMWLTNMSTFRGKVFSVQIDPREIPGIEKMGIPNYKSLLEIPEEIDYVVVSVPMQASSSVIRDCIEKKVGGVSMFTAGFAESGRVEGINLQRHIGKMAREAGLALLGPNCMGVYNPEIGLRFLPIQAVGEKGPVSFISQSGGHGGGFSVAAKAQGVAINKVVSVGNGVVLESTDFLDYFAHDEETKIIGMYVEDVKDGQRFFRLLREITPRKPVVIWKGGRTDEGMRATLSHTGALSGSTDTWDIAIKQCGAIGVGCLDQMIDVIKALACLPEVTGDGMGVIGWSGGQSVSVTDAFASAGLRVPLLQKSTHSKLEDMLRTVGASCQNPIDLGAMNDENMEASIEIVAQDANIDIVAVQIGGISTFTTRPDRLARIIRALIGTRDKVEKPFVGLLLSPDPYADGKALGDLNLRLQQAGIPSYLSYERSAYALRKLLDYYRFHTNGA